MQHMFRCAAIAGLLLVIVPPIAYYGTQPKPPLMATLMLVGTVVWFVGGALGFRRNDDAAALREELEPVA